MNESKPMIITPYKSEKQCQISCDVAKCFVLLSGLPGYKKWIDRILIFRPTGANIEFLQKNWPDARWEDGAEIHRDIWINLKMEEQSARAEKMDLLEDDSGYQYKTIPFASQKKSFLLARDRKNWAHLHEQGCGKTKIVLDTFAYLYEQNKVDTLIIIAPNGVHANWIYTEIPIHLPDRLKANCFIFTNHMTKREDQKLVMALTPKNNRRCTVVAFNVEGFVSQKAKRKLETTLKNHRCMVAVDESSCIQNPTNKRTPYLTKTCEDALYKRLLNGTAITRGVENLYSQFKFLDPRILGYDTYTTFKAQFCIMGGFESRAIVGYRHIQDLIQTIDGHSDRVLKKDCLDLPDKIYKRHQFKMTPPQKLLYDTVRVSALRELEEVFGKDHGGILAKDIAITRMIRLQQIACGWVPHTADEVGVLIDGPNLRMEALITLLGCAEGKAIIWVTATSSRDDIALITREITKNKLGKFVEYHGGVSTDDREKAKYQFQTNPNVRWFIASKAAAMGLTLTAAEQAFYYSNNFDLKIRLQSEDRCHRYGSEIHEHIIYTDICTTGIDKKIITNLRNKKYIADQINQDPKSIFMEEEE